MWEDAQVRCAQGLKVTADMQEQHDLSNRGSEVPSISSDSVLHTFHISSSGTNGRKMC